MQISSVCKDSPFWIPRCSSLIGSMVVQGFQGSHKLSFQLFKCFCASAILCTPFWGESQTHQNARQLETEPGGIMALRLEPKELNPKIELFLSKN